MRLARFSLIAALGVVVLIGGLVFAGLRALDSAAGRARIAAMLSDKLGQPVAIGGIVVSLLPKPSLAASDISVGGSDSAAAPGVALAGLRVVPRVSSLLPGRTLVLEHIELEGLRVSLRRDSTGRWLLPGAAAAPAAAASPAPEGPALEVEALRVRNGVIRVVDDSLRTNGKPTITAITDVEADLDAIRGTLNVRRFAGRLGTTAVAGSAELGSHGANLRLTSESLQNADLPALFALAGMRAYPGLSISGRAPVELATSVAPDFRTFVASGRAAIERVTLGVLTLDSLRSPFRFEKGVFTLDSLAFTLYGGRQRGAVTVDLSRDVPAYTIRTTITGLDVNRALAATVNMPNVLLGTGAASGTVTGSGSTADAIERSLAGNLKLELRNGTLKNYPLLANVNQLLGITGGTGSDTRFESLTATAVIGRGRAEVPDLALQAGELRMLGRGTVKFDRMVDFRLHAILSGEKSQQFAQRLRPVGLARDAKGQIDIPITVRGSAMAPTTRVEVGTYAKQRVREEIESGLLKLFDKDRP